MLLTDCCCCCCCCCLQAGVGVRVVLPGHAGGHQRSKPQRLVRRSVQDRRLHVGRPRRRFQKRKISFGNLIDIHQFIEICIFQCCNVAMLQCCNVAMLQCCNFEITIFRFQQVYKKKTEAAKKEYLKALAAYRYNRRLFNPETFPIELNSFNLIDSGPASCPRKATPTTTTTCSPPTARRRSPATTST